MAIRTIIFEATLDGISPKAPQNAGIQGEHNATTVVIMLSTQLITELNKPNTYYRFEFVDCMGQFDTTENFTLSSGAIGVNIDIPNGWTSSGGNAELRLVIVRLNVDNNEEMILYSLPCKLKFEGRDTGTGLTPETVEKGLSGLIADAKTATESANSAASSAINAGDYAIVRADYADSVAVIVELKGNYAKAQGDYAKLQGDYAKEKGDYASNAAADVNTAISNATSATNAANIAASSADAAASAANTAANAASQAANSANTAAANANTAADNANAAYAEASSAAVYANQQGDYAKTQGQAANTAALSANSAASSATTATYNANTKATYAQTQGDYAKEQGDYAKEQGDYAKAKGDAANEAAYTANAAADLAYSVAGVAQNIVDTIDEQLDAKADKSSLAETNLRVAEIGKDLSDYKAVLSQLNPNQEAKQTISDYGIVPLPVNAANGHMDVSVGGVTRTNILTENQADVETNTSGFLVSASATLTRDTTEKVFGNASLKVVTQGSTHREGFITDSRPISPLKTYIASVYLKGSGTLACFLQFYSGTTYVTQTQLRNIVLSSNWQRISLTGVAPENANNIRLTVRTAENTSQAVTFYADGIMIEESNKLNNWIVGTKSTVSAMRLRSVGKNLFNVYDFYNYFKINGTPSLKDNPAYLNIITLDGRRCMLVHPAVGNNPLVIYPFNGVPNQQYTIRFTARQETVNEGPTTGIGFVYSDGTKSSVFALNTTDWHTVTGTSVVGKTVIGLYMSYYYGGVVFFDINSIQLEQGTSATTYEPYTESALYIPDVGELRSTDTVQDEISYNKNTGQWVHIKRVDDNGTALSNPITTPISVSGTLLSYPKGTVYAEPVLPVAGIYTANGISVTNTDFPIESIERIYKIDFATGVETPIDVSKVVVAGNGLGFTHPDLADGDIVFFTYYHSVIGTNPKITATYYDSRYTVKDSVNNKFYRWKITVANGVPSIVVEEVS